MIVFVPLPHRHKNGAGYHARNVVLLTPTRRTGPSLPMALQSTLSLSNTCCFVWLRPCLRLWLHSLASIVYIKFILFNLNTVMNLPDDCVNVILGRLTAHAREIAACVCKSWYAGARKWDPVIKYYNDCVPSAALVCDGVNIVVWRADSYITYKCMAHVALLARIRGTSVVFYQYNYVPPMRLLYDIVRVLLRR